MSEDRNLPPNRRSERAKTQNEQEQIEGDEFVDESTMEKTNYSNPDDSLDDIEEGFEEFTETSDAIVMVVQDHVIRAEQVKTELDDRRTKAQERLDELAAKRLQRDLAKSLKKLQR